MKMLQKHEVEGEFKLMHAIFDQALKDARETFRKGAEKGKLTPIASDARNWIHNDWCVGVGSCAYLCALFGIDRGRLKAEFPL